MKNLLATTISLAVLTIISSCASYVQATDPLVATQRAGNTYFSGTAVGAAADARFNGANGIGKLTSGDYVISEAFTVSDNILKVLDGAFATVSSQTTTGFDISYPTAVMVAASTGMIHLIANSHQVVELDTSYVATLIAGWDVSGTADGVGPAARFHTPQGMAYTDTDSDILVADTGNDCIRSIVLTGGTLATVTTVAGVCGSPGVLDSAVGTTALFNQPRFIATAGTTGYHYVFDNTGIRRIQPGNNSAVETIVTREGNLYLPRPFPIFFDISSSVLYIQGSQGLWKVSDTANAEDLALSWLSMDLPLVSPSAVLPLMVANIVTAIGSNAVITIGVSTVGTYAPAPPQLSTTSSSVSYNANSVAGSGYAGNMVGTGDVSQFRNLQGLTQLPNGDLIACDTGNGVMRLLSSGNWGSPSTSTTVTTLAVTTGPAVTEPKTVLAMSNTQVYLVDTNQVLDYNPTTSTTVLMAGDTGTGLVNDADGSNARFDYPVGIVKSLTTIFVADSRNYCIRAVADTATYATTTSAGACGTMGHLDGVGIAAHFENPQSFGMADTSSAANLHMYVADNAYIRRVTGATFVVTTVTSLANYAPFVGAFFNTLTWSSGDSTLFVCDGTYVAKLSNFTTDGSEVEYPVLEYQQLNYDLSGAANRGTLLLSNQVATDVLFTSGTKVVRVDLASSTADSTLTAPPSITPMSSGSSGEMLVYTNIAGTDFSDNTDGTGVDGTFIATSAFGLDPITPFNYYVFDQQVSSTVVRAVTSAGVVTTTNFNTNRVDDVIFRSDGSCYLLSTSSNSVSSFTTATGAIAIVAGGSGSGAADGTGALATFYRPKGFSLVDTSATSDLIIADTLNGCLRLLIVATGVVTSPVGVCGTLGDLDATGTSARFKAPNAIALADTEGAYFIVDNQLLRKVLVGTYAVSTIARFGYDQRQNSGFGSVMMRGPLRWNPVTSTLLIAGGGSSLLEMKNLTASGEGYVYAESHPLALPPSLADSKVPSIYSLIIGANGLDISVLFSTKLGSINTGSTTDVAPTNPPL